MAACSWYGPRPRRSALDEVDSLSDLVSIPARAVLVAKQHERAGLVGARHAASVVQHEQREQSEHIGLVWHQLGEETCETNGLVTQLVTDECAAGRCAVALVEDEIHDREDGIKAGG